MDSVVAAVDFSLHQTGIATPPVGHSQAAIGGAFPQQQPPLHVKQNNDSSFHVSVIPLYIIETSTPVIVAFFQHSASCFIKTYKHKLSHWRIQMKPYLLGQGIFHVVDGLCCVLLLMFLTILLVLLWQSTHIFFVGSNIINLF
jgi:hypothetical protein